MKIFLFGLFFIVSVSPIDARAESEKLTLDDLSFMVGHWLSEGKLAPEERWFEPKNGVMSGFFRWPFEDGSQVFELLTFVENDEGIRFYFKHFNEKIDAWEKEEANIYNVTSVEEGCMEMVQISNNDQVPAAMQYCLLDDKTIQFKGINATQSWETTDFIIIMKRIS